MCAVIPFVAAKKFGGQIIYIIANVNYQSEMVNGCWGQEWLKIRLVIHETRYVIGQSRVFFWLY